MVDTDRQADLLKDALGKVVVELAAQRNSREVLDDLARTVAEVALALQGPAQHTCNSGRGPVFGRKTSGCPRCDELLAGAEPRESWGMSRAQADRQRGNEIAAHMVSERHRSGGCGLVCTFGDW